MKAKPTTKANKRGKAHAGNTDKGNTKRGKFRAKTKQPIAPAHIMEFIERISDGFVAFDAQMNYTYVNQRGGELLGRKPQELIGKNYWEEYPEARGTPFANAYVRALESQMPILTEDYYAPWDRWFENRIYPSSDGISILFTEITERKKAEEDVYKQNRFISVLAETIPGLVYVYDWETDSNVYSNGGIESMLGYTSEEVQAMGTKLFALLFNPDDAAAVVASQQRLASASDQDVFEIDYRLRHSNGEWRWLRSYERPFARSEDGSLKQKIGIAIDITERKWAEEQIQRQIKRLNALRTIDIAINSSFDLNVILNIVLQQILSQLNVDASAVLLIKSPLQTMEYAATRGFQSPAIQRAHLKLGEGYASRVVTERHTSHITDILRTEAGRAQSLHMASEGFVDYYGTPLIAKGEIKGVLEIYHRSPLNLNAEQLEFFEALAGQSAIAIDNAELFNSLRNTHMDLIMAYDATIEGWSRAMDLRDKETEGHTQRVTTMTLNLARAMGIREADIVPIQRGGLLHDIGKLGVPDGILLKPDNLTGAEWEIMRQHPTFAFNMLAPISYLRNAIDIPYCHHEKWDGSGYPRRLRAEQIPIAARIFAIADVWDAITSDRPYRKAWSKEEALEYIKQQSGKHFDPQVVDAFLKLIA